MQQFRWQATSPNTSIKQNQIDLANTAGGFDNGAIRLYGNGNNAYDPVTNPFGVFACENFRGNADIENNLVTNTLNGFAAMKGARLLQEF